MIVAIGRSGNFRKLGRAGRGPRQGLEPPARPEGLSRPARPGRGRRRLRARDRDRARARAARTSRSPTASPSSAAPSPRTSRSSRRSGSDPMADVAVEQPTSERVTTAAGPFMGEHRKPGSIRLMLGSQVKEIRDAEVVVRDAAGADETLPNDAVFTMIGREAPLDFFRRSGVAHPRRDRRPRAGPRSPPSSLFCAWLYHWKSGQRDPVPRQAASLAEPRPRAVVVGARGGRRRARGGARRPGDPPRHAAHLRLGAVLLLHARLLADRRSSSGSARIRRRRTPYVTRADADAHRHPGPAALPAARDPAPVAGAQRLVRRGRPEERGGRALPGGELRPRARVLARLRPHPGVAAQRLQRVHAAAALGLARPRRPCRRSC